MYVHNNSFLAISWQSAIQVSMLNFYCVKFRQDLKESFFMITNNVTAKWVATKTLHSSLCRDDQLQQSCSLFCSANYPSSINGLHGYASIWCHAFVDWVCPQLWGPFQVLIGTDERWVKMCGDQCTSAGNGASLRARGVRPWQQLFKGNGFWINCHPRETFACNVLSFCVNK